MRKDFTFGNPFVQSLITIIIIFCIDLAIPLGVAVGVLYVASMTLLVREEKSDLLYCTCVISLLVLLVPVFTFTPETTWMAYLNRGVSVFALWVVYFLVVKHQIHLQFEQYTAQVEKKNQELEEFAFIASHDLQEPLKTLEGIVDMYQREFGDDLDENAKQYFQFIEKTTTRMSTLIHGLLTHARIGQEPEKIRVNLEEVIADIKADFSASIAEKNVVLEVSKLPEIEGVRLDLRLLFQNLISNGIKFQKQGVSPHINISATEEQKHWKFAVSDNGIGIAREHQEKIFQIFKRLHRKEEYEGTGIGLAYCKKVVGLHNGRIWLTSKEGEGTTFYFTLEK